MQDSGEGESKRRKRKRVKATMDFVPRANGFGNPYVAFFPSGFDPLRSVDDSQVGQCTEFLPYRNSKPHSRQQELVAHGVQDVDFVGCNYAGEAASWQPCDYLLGVFNKAEGSLKLLPLEGEKMFRMEPQVRGLEYGRVIDKEVQEEDVSDAREADQAKRRQLIEAFGSQRIKMRAARSDRSKVKESDLEQDIKGLFQEASRNEGFLTSEQVIDEANAGVLRNIPPHDLTATTPQKAYLLNEMIRPDELEALANDVKKLEEASLGTTSNQQYDRNEVYPDFVLDRFKLVKVKGDTEGNQRRASILMYMRHLLAFHSAPDFKVRKAADPWNTSAASNAVDLTEFLGIPVPVVAKFLEIFTVKGKGSGTPSKGCERNAEHKNLTISYVLVLGLMVDNFEVDPYDLATELKMTVSQLKPHFENLGCKLVLRKPTEKKSVDEQALRAGKLKWKVTLPVPLKFPNMIARNDRQRGRANR